MGKHCTTSPPEATASITHTYKTTQRQYGVILDAGSSGTRIYVYKWKDPARSFGTHSLPELKLKESKKIHPGVSTFADNVSAVGPDHLQELIDVALDEVPADKVAETPVFLLATAGVRFLPKLEQNALLGGICSYLQANTRFLLPDCNAHIQVISGETEGLYGWIAANYLLGGFNHPREEQGKGHHHTYGFLDMGGASAQIAFAPNSTEAEKHANDLKLVRLRHMDGTNAEYRVFTTTWLGFGANKARERYVEALGKEYGEEVSELPDPCMPNGLHTTLKGDLLGATDINGQSLIGTGKFDECLRKTYPLLRKDAPCADMPCLINGQHAPAIDFNTNHFVGVSEYWHTTHGVFGSKKEAYDLSTYEHKVNDFCSRDWSDIESDLDKRKKTPQQKAADSREACFKASWLINMLYDGIGIPRVGLESNSTKESADEDSFRPVDKVSGVELSWTLGKMVLYAAGQVPVQEKALPVGFGTNVAWGLPDDWESAGSIPLLPVTGSSEVDDDDDDYIHATKHHYGGLMAIFLLLLLAWFILRKPERRLRIMNFARRRRLSGSKKPARGFPGASLANKLFGRSPHSYERVMEEGDAADFELGGMDSDDQSDSSEGTRGGRSSKNTTPVTPRLNADRLDELRPPLSVVDRQGLAVRTESRERLAGVGRRSRAGSPQRVKSSLKVPMER